MHVHVSTPLGNFIPIIIEKMFSILAHFLLKLILIFVYTMYHVNTMYRVGIINTYIPCTCIYIPTLGFNDVSVQVCTCITIGG